LVHTSQIARSRISGGDSTVQIKDRDNIRFPCLVVILGKECSEFYTVYVIVYAICMRLLFDWFVSPYSLVKTYASIGF
jgi:hypothetical protein